MLEKAIEMIEAQQAQVSNRSIVFFIGEDLKRICREDEYAAELVAQDLAHEEMSLAKLKLKFDAHAKEHRVGNESTISPAEANEIIRKFYGIPLQDEPKPKTVAHTRKPLSIFDYL